LLRVDPISVQLRGFRERFLNRPLCNFVEHNALITRVITTNDLFKVPRNRLSLPIQIGSEIYGISGLRELFKLIDNFLFSRQNLVTSGPTIFGIYTHSSHKLLALFLSLVPNLLVRRHFAGDGRLRRTLLWVGCRCTTRCR